MRLNVTGRGIAGVCVIVAYAFAPCAVYAQDEPTTEDAAAISVEDSETTEAETPADDVESTDIRLRDWFSGYERISLETRHNTRDSDIFLDHTLRLTVQPPTHPNVRLQVGTWTIADLDGHESSTSSISTLHNTFGASVQVRLLHLYLEADDLIGDSTLRIGRQRIFESPAYNRVDGVYFSRRMAGWSYYVFAGARASLYDGDHDDLTAGGGVAIDVTRRTRVAIDVFYGEEDRDTDVYRGFVAGLLGRAFPRRVKSEFDSRMVSLTVDHQWAPQHHLYGRYTLFDGQSDEVVLTATGVLADREIVYDLTFRRRDNSLADRANDVTGYYRILGEQDEFNEVYAAVYIPLNKRFTLGLDAQVRETSSDKDAWSNRDFQRFAATLDIHDIRPGLDASVSASWWNVEGDEGSFALTGDITKEWEKWELTVGVDFERWEDRIVEYRPYALPATRVAGIFSPFIRSTQYLIAGLFDTEVVETHENVYTGYAHAEYDLKKNQTLTFDISVQEDDGPDSPYWRLEAAYRLTF